MDCTSCSLLHTPFDLEVEVQLKEKIPYFGYLSRYKKVEELNVLKQALNNGRASVQAALDAKPSGSRCTCNLKEIHRPEVAERLANLPKGADQRKSPFAERIVKQNAWLNYRFCQLQTLVHSHKLLKFVTPVRVSKRRVISSRLRSGNEKKRSNM